MTAAGIALLAAAGLLAARAGDFPIACPASIEIDSKSAGAAPPGWDAHLDQSQKTRLLASAGFSDGHPRDGAHLRPSQATPEETRFSFPATYPEGIWISCAYRDTPLAMTRRLPDGVKSCVVRYGGKPLAAIPQIRCLKP